jgi:hypothetical protein
MALWGNNDAVGAGGLVSLNYSTGVVTGSGTTFGQVGAAATGDVIRFGSRVGTGTYFGDAVIVGIASTTQLTIGSTAGLSGVAIASTSFTVSQLPKYTILDSSFSEVNTASASYVSITYVGTATTNAGVGTDIVPVVAVQGATGIVVGDALVNGGDDILISNIGANTISLASTISAGISTGDILSFKRLADGYSKYAYGVAEGGTTAATGTSYALTHEGWVGVTTYMGVEGELRVKTETLVAMSGITTGNAPVFPPA